MGIAENLKAIIAELKEELKHKAKRNQIYRKVNSKLKEENRKLRDYNRHIVYDRDNLKEEVEKFKKNIIKQIGRK